MSSDGLHGVVLGLKKKWESGALKHPFSKPFL